MDGTDGEVLGSVVEILKRVEKNQDDQGTLLKEMERRMGRVESQTMVHSVLGGGAAAIAIGVAVEYFKARLVPGS
ncbi:MAG: hypothetical protein HQM02_08640 [Magnetococcales bacterium]|nr:hypothetical protein [Magnetococcales bacterium]